jgi:hypothetical protein
MIILVLGIEVGGATTTTFIGTSCTFIGNETGVNTATTVEYSTAIGYAAKITDSNQMMLGIAATTSGNFTVGGNSCSINIEFNSPSTKRIIFDEASSSQWGIYLSAYNALTKSLNGANTMGNGASVTSYAMRFSGANSAAEGFILKIPKCCFIGNKVGDINNVSCGRYYTQR